MTQVTKVIYRAAGMNRELSNPADASQIWQMMQGQFPELANGQYTVTNGVMEVSLRTGSKA